MHVQNPIKSREYFDSRVDERDDSAVRVIHAAWVEHTAPLGRLEHLEPTTPLDMLVLYQAAAATFRAWTPGVSLPESLSSGGRIVNREQARLRLLSVNDQELAALATRFANRVIALSKEAAGEQDLNYFVELFLYAVHDDRTIDGIMTGSISRHSKQLTDLNLW